MPTLLAMAAVALPVLTERRYHADDVQRAVSRTRAEQVQLNQSSWTGPTNLPVDEGQTQPERGSVVAWVEQLHRIEDEKIQITAIQNQRVRQVADQLQMGSTSGPDDVSRMSDPDYAGPRASARLADLLAEDEQEWRSLGRKLNEFPPPRPCTRLAALYAEGINNVADTCRDM